MDAEAGLTFRTATAEDVSFIHSSWANSYYSGSIAQKVLTPEEFHACHRPLRERVFEQPNKQILICTPDDDKWLILGWIAVEIVPSATVVHYIYVKSAFKLQGISSELIKRTVKTAPVIYTHLTERWSKIMARKPNKFTAWKYVPHLT